MSVLALAVLKHLCLLGVYAFCFLAARLVLKDRALAPLAPLSLWLIPQVAWESHRDLTHSVLGSALAMATVWLLLVLGRRRSAARYAWLGVVLGLAVLSKYNALALAAALAGAALAVPAFRRVLADRRVLLALAIAAVLVLPHAAWVSVHREEIGRAGLAKLAPHALGLETAVKGVWRLAWALVRFLGPPVLVTALFVPACCDARGRAASSAACSERA